jgi:hypothetical protein
MRFGVVSGDAPSLCGVLAVALSMQLAFRDESVEDGLTRNRPDTKQASRLREVERKPWHLAIHTRDHRDELGSGWFGGSRPARFAAPILRGEVRLHPATPVPCGRLPRFDAAHEFPATSEPDRRYHRRLAAMFSGRRLTA